MASAHPPTLLAAEAQSVCSQHYIHLLVLFQEIITMCDCACVHVCQFSVKSGKQVVGARQEYGAIYNAYIIFNVNVKNYSMFRLNLKYCSTMWTRLKSSKHNKALWRRDEMLIADTTTEITFFFVLVRDVEEMG